MPLACVVLTLIQWARTGAIWQLPRRRTIQRQTGSQVPDVNIFSLHPASVWLYYCCTPSQSYPPVRLRCPYKPYRPAIRPHRCGNAGARGDVFDAVRAAWRVIPAAPSSSSGRDALTTRAGSNGGTCGARRTPNVMSRARAAAWRQNWLLWLGGAALPALDAGLQYYQNTNNRLRCCVTLNHFRRRKSDLRDAGYRRPSPVCLQQHSAEAAIGTGSCSRRSCP